MGDEWVPYISALIIPEYQKVHNNDYSSMQHTQICMPADSLCVALAERQLCTVWVLECQVTMTDLTAVQWNGLTEDVVLAPCHHFSNFSP